LQLALAIRTDVPWNSHVRSDRNQDRTAGHFPGNAAIVARLIRFRGMMIPRVSPVRIESARDHGLGPFTAQNFGESTDFGGSPSGLSRTYV
jgi:hypothetical protein